jgi:hypothetical protein
VERRRANRYRRRDPRRYLEGKPLHGWTSQQLVKLAAPQVIGTDIVFCVDSDIVLLQPLTVGHGRDSGGAPLLFEGPVDSAVTAAWAIRSMEVMGLDLAHTMVRQHTFPGASLHRATCERLRTHLEGRADRPWWEVFLREGLAEYQTYGVFAREVDVESPLVPAPPLDVLTYWIDPGDVLTRLVSDLRDRSPLAVCVQSNLRLAPGDVRAALAPLWA